MRQNDLNQQRRRLFGMWFADMTLEQTANYIVECVRKNVKQTVHTVNVDHLVLREQDEHYRKASDSADLITADGMPIVWFSRLVGRALPERVAGADLVHKLLLLPAEQGLRFFFLGTTTEVCAKAREVAMDANPSVQIVGFASPTPGELRDPEVITSLQAQINESGANVLLVALGAPKQEILIYRWEAHLDTVVNIGVGASLDFLAGKVARAPRWVQRMGIEWLYRLSREPRRMWRRYLIRDSRFVIIALRELFASR
ncbi:WecB/TagA/CpsF family glycosyltransferase [Alicyclobacillus hesperidum]|uniref:WecB/TagA/CpsF family glycosyltransferase n=1 Tax=Alicyclobacillus hesperidum TaxID=89784 RepID=UPI0002E5B92D|nr:WecB/TagA/CpsF family glycosyltransferase [Alicyclobacillus hesperidum]